MADTFLYNADVSFDHEVTAEDQTAATVRESKTRTVVAPTIEAAVQAVLTDCSRWGPEYSNFIVESCAKAGVVNLVAGASETTTKAKK